MKSTHAALGLIVGLVALASAEREARACGGCFAPTEFPTVVTDHRMIFTVAGDQSSLYDQIKYSGNPASFAWVLPFSGEIQVGVSSDAVFSALDGLSQTQILAPPTNCPTLPPDCQTALSNSVPGSAEDAKSGGVEVLKQEVVGPYETVQLKATDSDALQKWLADHGYSLPDDVRPVVTAYQKQNFNFLALKLVPGAGVQAMRPVRVTTKGSNVALPLRMVAAGAGATVGITLWIIAEGRYHPTNFGVFDIKAEEQLVWDWSQQKSNFIDLRAQKTAAANGRAWEVENSNVIPRSQIQQYVGYYAPYDGDPTNPDGLYPDEKDAQGTVTKPGSQVQTEDFEALFHGIPDGAERITRLRADLAHAALDQDLVVGAAADQSPLLRQRQVVKEQGEPLCPVYNGCERQGSAPRSQAIATTDDNNSGCKIAQREGSRSSWLVVALGFIGLSLGRKHRRGRR